MASDLPSETPVTERDLKRALLTYDKVVLADPNDRDVIPSNAFMLALGMPPIFGMDMGPIRPLGKIKGHDERFSTVLDSAKGATQAGLIEVRSTYKNEGQGVLTIGSVPTGGYPLNIQLVFWLYRSMSNSQDFLLDAVREDTPELLKEMQEADSVSLEGRGDGSINNVPALPMLGKVGNGTDPKHLTQVARARLAAFVKYAGYCEAKNLVPVFPSVQYGGIAQRLLNNARGVISENDPDRFWARRNRVLELCHEEFLADERLDKLTFPEVLKLRTKAWGKQAEAREGLFESVFALAQEHGDSADFIERVRPQIEEYRAASEDLTRERQNLAFQIKCDLGSAALVGGPALVGLMSQLGSPAASIGLTLAAGGLWAFDKAKQYVPMLRQHEAMEKAMKRGAGFGLHDFYSRIGTG